MSGALATQQGNCSVFKFEGPHCRKKDPVIVDLMPDALPENRTEHCCCGGLLDAWGATNPSNSSSSFAIKVGSLEGSVAGHASLNLTLMAPGPAYSTCGPLLDVKPTVLPGIGGRRQVQVFRTWKATCTYSSFFVRHGKPSILWR